MDQGLPAATAVTLADIVAAAGRIAGLVARTPILRADRLSRELGATVLLKLESLQAIGSFKERGAANRIALLTRAERARGVIAMSAGNHAQGVARHASLAGIEATIVMPTFTPLAKIAGTQGWGARVVLHGETLADAAAHAFRLAEEEGRVFVHPYDDPAIIAGQGTMALEILQDEPAIDALLVPVGGGGLISGAAIAAAATRPGLEVIGVQVAPYSALAQRRGAASRAIGGSTIAEGIAVLDIGRLTAPVIQDLVSDVLVVDDLAVEDAICALAESAKLVAEGAGAAALAAVMTHRERFAGRRVAMPVCGGNIDVRILANVMLRGLMRDGRLLRLRLDIPDRPGILADIAACIAGAAGNIIEVNHQRLFASPSVQSARLEVMVEARDPVHAETIRRALAARHDVARV